MPFSLAIDPVVETTLSFSDQHVFYRIFRPQHPRTARRLLLIHGAGVAGVETWGQILPHLEQWTEILVPDIRGTGHTRYPDHREHSFWVEDVVQDIWALLNHLGWQELDLGGYSFGGMVAMLLKQQQPNRIQKQYLLEPGLLIRLREEDARIAHDYLAHHAAKGLRDLERFEDGLDVFLDAVSPKRNKARSTKAATLIQLMSKRPIGMACVVEAAAHLAQRVDRQALLAAQEHVSFFVGERSNAEIYQLSRAQEALHQDWRTHLIAGSDHGLPYQQGSIIAQHMNADLQSPTITPM